MELESKWSGSANTDGSINLLLVLIQQQDLVLCLIQEHGVTATVGHGLGVAP